MGRANRRIRKDEQFQPSGDSKRIISLGKGSHAYLKDHLGKTVKYDRFSDEFVQACILNDEKMAGKISRDLESLGWTDVIERMNAVGEGQEVVESV